MKNNYSIIIWRPCARVCGDDDVWNYYEIFVKFLSVGDCHGRVSHDDGDDVNNTKSVSYTHLYFIIVLIRVKMSCFKIKCWRKS